MRFSMILGGSSGAISTLMYWAVARQFVHVAHVVAILSILAVAICMSCGLIIGSIFKLTLICGGSDKGPAVGVAKGFVGLGSGVYATIFQALRTSEETALDFIPVMSVFFIVCVVVPAYFLLLPRGELKAENMQTQTTPLHFHTLYLSLFILACVIVASSVNDIIAADDGNSAAESRNFKKTCMLLTIWLGPIWSLLILPKRSGEELEFTKGNDSEILTVEPPPSEKTSLVNSSRKSIPTGDIATLQEPPELNLLEMLQTPSAWLMLWTTTILVGSGTYKTNNMAEMVESLDFPKAINPATLALFSVSQCFGRIITGIISEAALKWPISCCGTNACGVARPFFLIIASAIAFVSHLMLAYATDQTFFIISCTFSGLAFGMAWPLMVLIVGDVFGLKHHGANYMMFDGTTKAIGTILLSEYVAGNVYEGHVDASVDARTCYGTACFRETHLIVSVLGLTGIVASLALMHTTRHAY